LQPVRVMAAANKTAIIDFMVFSLKITYVENSRHWLY